MSARHFKDAVLDELAAELNVAQFVSFAPDLALRYARIYGTPPNHQFDSLEQAVSTLLAHSPERSVNVRSYDPDTPESREFVYGLRTVDDITATIRRLAGTGLYTICNETIDVRDGGVSGVVLGGIVEFAPDDTPRAVEKPDVASLPRSIGAHILSCVYGFPVTLSFPPTDRIEFSIHPQRRGVRHEHIIVWERRAMTADGSPRFAWPNRFSRLIGDKVFGLLVAEAIGLKVPRSTVVARRVAPFTFGSPTGSAEPWLRTSPVVQVPGHFTTVAKWTDPFSLVQREDPDGTALASVISQEGVNARWSGAAIATPAGEPIIEGVVGTGDRFMLGQDAPVALPAPVEDRVRAVFRTATATLGPVRFEWVDDGETTWVVQLHRGATSTHDSTIVPGEPARYRRFRVDAGIDAFRSEVDAALKEGDGIILVGDVGITSHFGDVLRRARVPSRLERSG
jgi:hypothetical protein